MKGIKGKLDARHESCAVTVGRRVYIIGGRNSKRVRTLDVFDPYLNTIENRPGAPVEMHHMQCAVWRNRWIIAGGSWEGRFPGETPHSVLWWYDTVNKSWLKKKALPVERRRGGAAFGCNNNYCLLTHGNFGGHGPKSKITVLADKYDPIADKWTALPNAKFPRDHVGGAFLGNKFCVVGGRDGTADPLLSKPVAQVECLVDNGGKFSWQNSGSLSVPRSGMATGATCFGTVMTAGGEGRRNGNNLAFVRVDSFKPGSFQTAGTLKDSRHGTGLGIMDCSCGNIYMPAGSGNAFGFPELSTIEKFSPDGEDRAC